MTRLRLYNFLLSASARKTHQRLGNPSTNQQESFRLKAKKHSDNEKNTLVIPAAVGEVFLYATEDGLSRIEARLEGETVWLSQNQMADLFQTTKKTSACIFKMYMRKVSCQRNNGAAHEQQRLSLCINVNNTQSKKW